MTADDTTTKPEAPASAPVPAPSEASAPASGGAPASASALANDEVPVAGNDAAVAGDDGGGVPRWRRVVGASEINVGAGLLVIVVIFAVLAPHAFLTVDNARNLALDNATLAILAMGTTVVLVGGGLDLSAGSVVALTQMLTGMLFGHLGGTDGGWGASLAGLLAAVGIGLACGAVNGFVITRMSIAPFIATLATGGIAFGAAEVLSNGTDLATVPSVLAQEVGLDRIAGIPPLVLVAVAVVLLTAYLLGRTGFGRHTYAIGSDATAAQRAGIPVARHRFLVYTVAGGTYGLVAFLDLARLSTTTVGGYSGSALLAISAVAIGGGSLYGGVGTAVGTLIGVSIPAVLQNGLVITGASSYYEQIGVGVALILALYADRLRRRSLRLD